MTRIQSIEQLEELYGPPGEAALVKVADHITAEYQRILAASPFAALATAGPEGLDCSPRGDQKGFVKVRDERTLLLPDRRGNNRTDSLRNIVRDPRVALLFLIPGSGTTLRVNGRAYIDTDVELCASFAMGGALPRCVVVILVDAVYFQCARAILRSDLWNPEHHADAKNLPSPGEILAAMTSQRIDGEQYDRQWPERARTSLW
ncbi:MAG: pyridoxamine 5'-phosphate oxidase family protein [Burkholderiaceae bacterium]|jgi:PPOX class probable FMN-dependent enzyme